MRSASWAWRLVPSPHRGHRLAAQRCWLLREKISDVDNRAITAIRVVENNAIVFGKKHLRQSCSLSSPSEQALRGISRSVELTKLEKLDLRGNPIPIPPEILGPRDYWRDPGNLDEILTFYFQVQDPNETEQLYEAKLLIVGEGEAGKTTLAKKIEDENYQLNKDEESTHGIEVIQGKEAIFGVPDCYIL